MDEVGFPFVSQNCKKKHYHLEGMPIRASKNPCFVFASDGGFTF